MITARATRKWVVAVAAFWVLVEAVFLWTHKEYAFAIAEGTYRFLDRHVAGGRLTNPQPQDRDQPTRRRPIRLPDDR
jgi:hypothetical protein